MQTLEGSSRLRPQMDLALKHMESLRQSTRWSNPTVMDNKSTDLLHGRLDAVLVLELHIDGGRRYLNLSVRGLYKHVIAAITHRMISSPGDDDNDNNNGQHGQEEFERMRRVGGACGGSGLLFKASIQDNVTSSLPQGQTTSARIDENQSQKEVQEPQLASSLDSRQQLQLISASTTNPTKSKRKSSVSFQNNSVSVLPADAGGVATTTGKESEVTYRERLGGYLHPRDMRRLVTPFSTSNEPDLIVRRHVMLLNFDPLRTIILRDRLLVIVPDGADSILGHLETRVRGGNDEVEKSIFGVDASEHNSSSSVPQRRQQFSSTETNIGLSISEIHHPQNNSANKSNKSRLEKLLTKVGEHEVLVDNELPLLRSFPKRVSSELSDDQGNNDAGNTHSHSPDGTEEEEDDDNDEKEWAEMQGREWTNLPFELQCADAVLHVVGSILQEDTAKLQKAAFIYIQRLLNEGGGMQDDPLTIIRAVKDEVGAMTSRVKSFVQSMNRVLDEDEDMALMNLSRLLTHPERFIKPVPQSILDEESDEPELILEAHLQGAFTLLNSLNLIKGQINTASELVDRKLDATRNRLLLVNIVVSILSLSVTTASLVGSIFGMNLVNPYEDDPHAFVIVTTVTIGGSFGLGLLVMTMLLYSGTIPRFGGRSAGPIDE